MTAATLYRARSHRGANRHRGGGGSGPGATAIMFIAIALGGAILLMSSVLARCSGPDGVPAIFTTGGPEAPSLRPAAGLVDHPGEPLPTQ